MSTSTNVAQPTYLTSPDETRIAVFISGHGRPMVLVHGATADHTTWRLVAPLLEPHLEVQAVDRRGRGASGDSPQYALERECEDVAAVVDAASARWGGPVDLFGHSYGGNIAFRTALRNDNVRRLILYEGWPVPDPRHRKVDADTLALIDDLIAQDRRAEALEVLLRAVVHLTDEELDFTKAAPTWPVRVAAVHTVPRELRAFSDDAFDPMQAAQIGTPVLLLVGSESPEDLQADPAIVAAALPQARIEVLQGEAHLAYLTSPEDVARTVLDFLGTDRWD